MLQEMSGFDGFSREDINKLTGKPNKILKPMLGGRGIRRLQETKSITSTSNMVQKNNTKNENLKTNEPSNKQISDESLTSLQEAVHFQPLATIKNKNKNIQFVEKSIITDDSILHIDNDGNNSSILPDQKNQTNQQQLSPFKGISLKDFESNRQLKEEQNKQKKELLYKAIEMHTEKTAAEVKKIEEIKIELSKLDEDLAADVAILRKQIDLACIQYSNIQKHYNKIESTFLRAKMDLHNASEKKELLTEHLCTVITHNEDRKAKKLTELMDKVGISTNCEEFENNNDGEIVEK